MRTRTNLHLDNDALAFASSYAGAKGITLGVAVSELIRRAEQLPPPQAAASPKLKRDGRGFLVARAGGPAITSETVREESEDELG